MVLPVTTVWVCGIRVYRDSHRVFTVCVCIYTHDIYISSKWLSFDELQIKLLRMSSDSNLSPGIATGFLKAVSNHSP